MLPLKAGTVELSKESKQKLDFFYNRYCEGENGRQYGVGHIVYACHAAFPLIISPELANLTWLNFNTYANHRGNQKTDRVAVSDFLLSSLMRPVANRQYEMIPEIRTYLLALLQSGKWFNLFGITGFGETRLMELAQFLQAYLANKKSNEENNANGFREVNEWAAFAYLQPDLLAGRIAAALEKTFSKNSGEADDEMGQLRLNVLLERFSRQVDHKIYKDANAVTPGVFLNLYRYSMANKARLFEKTTDEISDISYGLDEAFIGDALPNSSFVQLPLLKGAGERLKRKKEGVQRVHALYIGIDKNPKPKATQGRVLAAETMQAFVKGLLDEPEFERGNQVLLKNDNATGKEIDKVLTSFYIANGEDVLLIFYSSGLSRDNNQSSSLIFSGDDEASTNEDFKRKLSVIKAQKVLVLETDASDGVLFANDGDVQIVVERGFRLRGKEESGSTKLLEVLMTPLIRTDGKISYRDLHRLMKYYARNEETAIHLTASPANANHFFLSHRSPVRNFDNLLIYDTEEKGWTVLENDFVPIIPNTALYVFEYDSGKQMEEVVGEVFMRNGKIAFGGKTEMLDQGKIYGLLAQRRPLYYELENSPTPELENALNKLSFDARFAWQFLIKRMIGLNSNSPEQTLTAHLPRLIVSSMDSGGIIGYELTYLDKGDGTKEEEKLNWWVDGLTALSNSLQAFASYYYLLKQASGEGLEALYPPFNIQLNGFWQTGSAKTNMQTDNFGISITPESIFTDNGRVRFHPYILSVKSNEDFPVYIAVYLLLSNFHIRRIPLANKETFIPPNGSGTVLLSDDELMENIAGGLLKAHIKILVSRNPINTDYSQTGLN